MRQKILPGNENRSPPPSIVLGGKLKIGQRHGDARGHAEQNEKHDGQNAEQRVLIATPKSRENVVEFD